MKLRTDLSSDELGGASTVTVVGSEFSGGSSAVSSTPTFGTCVVAVVNGPVNSTLNVMTRVVPAGTVPIVHVIVEPLKVHGGVGAGASSVHEPATYVDFEFTVSVTTTFVAVPGPAFV